MNLLNHLADKGVLPDALIRHGIRRLDQRRLMEEARGNPEQKRSDFIEMMHRSPIAIHTDKANDQHYELPPEFFRLVLGKHLKYSGCYWDQDTRTLDEAEAAMLQITAGRAGLADGMDILELGCGWGSLSLWMAERFPKSRIVSLSNSRAQGEYIRARAAGRNLANLSVLTADMNDFSTDRLFDRIVSVEMFEHMRNWPLLLKRISAWLKPKSRLFIHIFSHTRYAYAFEVEANDWMGQYFFSGGMMPSEALLLDFQDDLAIEAQWRVNGRHYSKTAEAWLKNLDTHREQVVPIMAMVYGEQNAKLWLQRWRIFFMACAELWGYGNGGEWTVSHYLLKKKI